MMDLKGAMSDGAIVEYATRPLKEGEYLYGAFDGDHLCGVGELDLRPQPRAKLTPRPPCGSKERTASRG